MNNDNPRTTTKREQRQEKLRVKRRRQIRRRGAMPKLRLASAGLVEAAAGAVFGVVVAFGLAFAHLFGVAAGFVVAGFLLGCGEDALFGAAEALVGVHAFEEKLGGADGYLGFGFGVDFERGEFFEEALNLLELFEGAGGGLRVIELHGAAEVEPLLDLLGVGAGEVLVEDAGYAGADDLADDGVGAAHLAFVLELDLAADAGERGVDVADSRHDQGFVVQ